MEKILFDRNHVKVTSEELGPSSYNYGKWRIYWSNDSESVTPKGMTITVQKKKFEKVIKESPLGFYYNSTEEIEYEEESKITVRLQYHIVTFYLYNTAVKVKYPVKCNDVEIGFDARPWDICVGDKSMQEHIIKVLQKILDDIIFRSAPIKEHKRTKEKLYTELFGNANGYTTLSNEIKILSHGFDPKESFRKRKKK